MPDIKAFALSHWGVWESFVGWEAGTKMVLSLYTTRLADEFARTSCSTGPAGEPILPQTPWNEKGRFRCGNCGADNCIGDAPSWGWVHCTSCGRLLEWPKNVPIECGQCSHKDEVPACYGGEVVNCKRCMQLVEVPMPTAGDCRWHDHPQVQGRSRPTSARNAHAAFVGLFVACLLLLVTLLSNPH